MSNTYDSILFITPPSGVFVVRISEPELAREIMSNVLSDSSYIYFSSKEQLARIDKLTGNVVWRVSLPKDFTSKSSIIMSDNTIYMINRGYALVENGLQNFGKPFIAAFDKETGVKKFLYEINLKNSFSIFDYQFRGDELYLVFNNRVAKYNTETGAFITQCEIKSEGLKYFLWDDTYIADERSGGVYSLTQYDRNKIFVATDNNRVLAFDSQLNLDRPLGYENLYKKYLESNNYKFIAKVNSNTTLILDSEGHKIAEIEASSKSFLVGKTLYDRHGDSFFAIDLEGIMKEE